MIATTEILLSLIKDYENMRDALNKIAILQMGGLDYTTDFFEQTKVIVRETLANLEIKQ